MSWSDFESGCSQNGRFERPLATIIAFREDRFKGRSSTAIGPKILPFGKSRRIPKFFIDTSDAWKSRICCVPSSATSKEEESDPPCQIQHGAGEVTLEHRTRDRRCSQCVLTPGPDQTRKAISSDQCANQWREMKTAAFLQSEFAVMTSIRGR